MNILILDTETNGLPQRWGADPKNFELFPEILSIAWIMWDTENDEVAEEYFVIDREIKTWDKYAQEVNGFNQMKLKTEGLSFDNMAGHLDLWMMDVGLIVCHNVAFDIPILEADLIRNGYEFSVIDKPTYCTMQSTSDLVKLPRNNRPYGNDGYKWPKLPELYKFLFKENMEDKYKAHNALEDTRCTLECFKELVRIGYVDLSTIKERIK